MNLNADTVEDEISQFNISIILGVTTTPPGKGVDGTWSIWPSGRPFEAEFRGWDGEWNDACEQWFTDCWSCWEGRAKVHSGHKWKHSLNRDPVEGLLQKVEKIPSATWSTTLDKLKVDMAEVWPASNCLSDLWFPIE